MGFANSDGLVRSWVRGSLIGAGAFGKVNLALNTENGNLIAVKSVECDERSGSELVALENEIRILESIDSPHVVQFLGSNRGIENGKWMSNLFMEYMSGGSLADLMNKFGGCLDEKLVRTYTRGILQGLHHLHSNGIVHCDIKGRNVLVGSSGVKLADFGAAKRLKVDGDKIENLMHMKGTPLWMAPEVVRQEEQGTASDIWSLGCTVMEMVTGKAPWRNLSNISPMVAMYHIGCTDEVPEIPSSLSLEGQDFLQKCFCRNPKQRWSSAQLLEHPFVTQQQPIAALSDMAPLSPTSVLDKWNSQISSVVNSIPILSLKRDQIFRKLESRDINLESPSDQTINNSNLWGSSPLSPKAGQWIVVHSPKTCPPIAVEAVDLFKSMKNQNLINDLLEDARPESDSFPMESCSSTEQESKRSRESKSFDPSHSPSSSKLVTLNPHAHSCEPSFSSSDLSLRQEDVQNGEIFVTVKERHSVLYRCNLASCKSSCTSKLYSVLQRSMIATLENMYFCCTSKDSYNSFDNDGDAHFTYAPPIQFHYSQIFVKLPSINKREYRFWFIDCKFGFCLISVIALKIVE